MDARQGARSDGTSAGKGGPESLGVQLLEDEAVLGERAVAAVPQGDVVLSAAQPNGCLLYTSDAADE